MRRSRFLGVGGYLPERVMTNEDLSRLVATDDRWIVERTGIKKRHIAAEGEFTSDLGTVAARRALEAAEIGPEAIDLIVVATSTPDHTFPASATAIQRKLGAVPSIAFDVQAVCSGFVYALTVADSFLLTRRAETALVIGAETFSRILDWTDRGTCVLFGDGAGAVVLRADQGEGIASDRGVLATRLGADGHHYQDLWVDGGPSTTGTSGHLRMNGREVFRNAVARLTEASQDVLAQIELGVDDIAWLVPHQANSRILDAVGKRLGVPADRVLMTVDRHANTSAASIPLALADAVENDLVHSGDLLVLNAIGGGFAWGAAAVRW